MNLILSTLLLAAVVLTSHPALATGGTRAQHLEAQQILDSSATAGPAAQLGTKLMRESLKTLVATYDFAVLGGASGSALSLRGSDGKPVKLPRNAIVRDCLIDVLTAPESLGSATIALGTGQAANDLKAALAIGSYTGRVACVPVGSAATAIKLTADRTMSATVAVAPLTAGKINVIVDYLLSE